MPTDIIIREMQRDDITAARQLWVNAFHAGYSSAFDTEAVIHRYLDRNPNLSTVASTKDGTLVGALMCGHDGRRGSIYHTAVHPDYRHQGIAKRMEQRSISALRAIGITTGFLFIHIKNEGSQAFWHSMGWETIEDIRYLYKQF